MSEIPVDILNKSAEHVENMPHRPPFKADMLNAIAKAIADERERCASIADGFMYDFGCVAGTESADLVICCADIARSIRGTS